MVFVIVRLGAFGGCGWLALNKGTDATLPWRESG